MQAINLQIALDFCSASADNLKRKPMPITRKSVKSTRRHKRVSRPKGPHKDLAHLIRLVGNMAARFDQLEVSGLLTLARQMTTRSPRRPLPEYAKVVAVGAADEVSEVCGRTGIVLDVADLDGSWTYTVYFPTRQEAVVVHETSLWDTGETVPEDVIYGGGETRHVRVDAQGSSVLVA